MARDLTATTKIEQAKEVAKTDPAKAEALFKSVLSTGPGRGEAALADYELALMGLGVLYRDGKKANELSELVQSSKAELSSFAKAKTAKISKDALQTSRAAAYHCSPPVA